MRFPRRLRSLTLGVTALIVGPIVAVLLTAAPGHKTPNVTPLHATRAAAELTDRGIPQDYKAIGRVPSPNPTPTPTPRPAPPKPKAAAVSIPPSWNGDVASIIMAAAARWGVDGNWMVRIAHCESGLRPNAYNPRGPYYGLFQFLMSTFRANGGTNIWDPADQSNIAAKMLAHGQAHQWSCA